MSTYARSRSPRYDGLCRLCGETPRRYTNGLCRECDATYRRELRERRRATAPFVPVHKRWTDADNALLSETWGHRDPGDLVQLFQRSYDSLRVQASKLGLKSNRRGGNKHKFDNEFGCTCANSVGRCWSPDEVAKLTLTYQSDRTIEQIATMLGRTPSAVLVKANRLGILRRDPYEIEDVA